MKKLIYIIMAITFLLSFTACTDSNKSNESASAASTMAAGTTPKILADETANLFLEAATDFNFKDAFTHIQNKDSYTMPFENLDAFFEITKNNIAQSEPEVTGMNDYIDSFLVPIYKKYVEKISYTINSSEEKDGKFIYTVDLHTINPQDLTGAEYDQSKLYAEVVSELYESGILTDEMTDDEKMNVLSKPLMEKMSSYYLEALETAPTQTKSVKLVIENIDGKYLITDESELSELISSPSLG